MTKYEKYCELAKKMGAPKAIIIDTDNIIIEDWVRLKCKYGCGGFRKYLTCPPFSPTPEETRNVIKCYSKALLMIFENISFEDDKDDNVSIGLRDIVFQLEREFFLDGYYKAFGMAAGPCHFCDECDTSSRCKFSEKVRPSMESCGIDVYKTLKNCGFKLEVVKSYDDMCKFAALVLIE